MRRGSPTSSAASSLLPYVNDFSSSDESESSLESSHPSISFAYPSDPVHKGSYATPSLDNYHHHDDAYVAFADDEGNTCRIPLPLHQCYARSTSSIALLVLLMGIPFLLGSQARLYYASKQNISEQTRDELMLNQEQLLLDLARTRRTAKEHEKLLEHMDLLRKELEEKTSVLSEETKRRQAAEQQVDECWNTYDLNTGMKSGMEKQHQNDMTKLSRTLATKFFGSGPHYVEFEFTLDKGDSSFFTIELASLEMMPASVFTFLQQVDLGLWDDASFYLNAPHALFAQPVSASDGRRSRLVEMEEAGLAHIPFQEYNQEFPHKEYTLGFGGDKQLGPPFYINKVDNSSNHAGQPCFARVVIGQETIDRIGAIENVSGDPYIKPVSISSVRIVKDLTQAFGGEAYLGKLAKERMIQDEEAL